MHCSCISCFCEVFFISIGVRLVREKNRKKATAYAIRQPGGPY